MPYYQIKLKTQYILLQWQKLSQDFQACVIIVIIILFFTKELKFFFITPGIVGLLCILMSIKYLRPFSVWVWLLSW